MTDLHILPGNLIVGDVITSDPRRDYTVRAIEIDPEWGDALINAGDPDQIRIMADQPLIVSRQA